MDGYSYLNYSWDSFTMWFPLLFLIVLQLATFGLFIRLMRKAMH